MAQTTRKRDVKGEQTQGENPGYSSGDNTGCFDSDDGVLQRLEKLDVKLTNKLAVCASKQSAYGFLRPVMQVLEYSCHGIPWIFFTLVAILMTHQIHIHQKLMNLFLGLMFDLLIVVCVKTAFRRQRPHHNQDDMFGTVSVDKFSFPSGHATRAGMLACLLMAYFPLQGPGANYLYLAWSLSVAVSRIILGRHHVFDVICGLLIGFGNYYILVNWLWLSAETCEAIILPIQEDLHL